jgi:hypothetical protein
LGKNPDSFFYPIFRNLRFLIFEIFFLKKWHGFSSKSWTFPCSTKIWLEKDFPKIPKTKLFRRVSTIIKSSRILIFDHLLAVNIGEKVGFSKAHFEVRKQKNLDFSFRGLNPSPLLKSNLHMKSLRLDPWPSGSCKSQIYPNFEVNLTKYIRNSKSADHRRSLFGPSTSLRRKNCRGVWPVVRLTAIWTCAFHHMEYSQLWSHLSPPWKLESLYFGNLKVNSLSKSYKNCMLCTKYVFLFLITKL